MKPIMATLGPMSGASQPVARPMRVLLFTDTLGDVNGVSRFIRNIAAQAAGSGRDLHVVTSTRLGVPREGNIVNVTPIFAGKMPRYENLEVVLPPVRRMMRAAEKFAPDVIHVSTPGPVGVCGVLAARRLGVPVAGVYHTDFPAYIDRLFDDDAFTLATRAYMKAVYRRFAAVFTRSHEYSGPLQSLGVPAERIHRLQPGIDTAAFSPSFGDEGMWPRVGVPREGVKVLYCGRVSVEKNLPFLSTVWKRVSANAAGLARLIVVGDGPYQAHMRGELEGTGAHFLGFRHGRELSAIYASSDLFVFPSTTDTLGQVVMESQCSGLPVIVSDQGGPKEVVRHEQTGFVLPASNPRPWVEAIQRVVADSDLRARRGAAAERAIRPLSIAASFEHFWTVHEGISRARGSV